LLFSESVISPFATAILASTLMPSRIESGADEGEVLQDPSFVPLTQQQAQELRQRVTMLSPWRVVWAQAAVGGLCVALAELLVGGSAGISALYGAGAVVLPNLLLARGLTKNAGSAVGAVARFLIWELLKMGAAVAMLVIAARVVPDLNWPALLLTVVVCTKVNWVALAWRPR